MYAFLHLIDFAYRLRPSGWMADRKQFTIAEVFRVSIAGYASPKHESLTCSDDAWYDMESSFRRTACLSMLIQPLFYDNDKDNLTSFSVSSTIALYLVVPLWFKKIVWWSFWMKSSLTHQNIPRSNAGYIKDKSTIEQSPFLKGFYITFVGQIYILYPTNFAPLRREQGSITRLQHQQYGSGWDIAA